MSQIVAFTLLGAMLLSLTGCAGPAANSTAESRSGANSDSNLATLVDRALDQLEAPFFVGGERDELIYRDVQAWAVEDPPHAAAALGRLEPVQRSALRRYMDTRLMPGASPVRDTEEFAFASDFAELISDDAEMIPPEAVLSAVRARKIHNVVREKVPGGLPDSEVRQQAQKIRLEMRLAQEGQPLSSAIARRKLRGLSSSREESNRL